jgi:hypothetical protein
MNERSLEPILNFVLAERSWPSSPNLVAMAKWLPAVPCAGMEIPLGEEGHPDLQLRIRTQSEVDRLAGHLQRLAENKVLPPVSLWWRVLQFCRTELLTGQIEDLWLELDDDNGVETIPPLSVFIHLPDDLPQSVRFSTIERLLSTFDVEPGAKRRDALIRCLDACPPKVRVSHLGVMLGRPGMPIRLIVDRIGSEDLADFLKRAGFPGSTVTAQYHFDCLCTYVDRIRLAITVDDFLLPTLGFECFVGRPEKNDPRWRPVFDLLVKEGMCRQERRESVLAWPAILTPAETTGDWPHELVMEALRHSPQKIGWLECRISHVKVTLTEGRPPAAKAYFGFVEEWADTVPSPPSTHVIIPSGRGLEAAITAAMDFLMTERTQSGWWLDYDGFQEGVSDEWVTAYVAHAMAESGDSRGVAAARRAWALLARRGRTGWGWNGLQPADADSTLWALRLAGRIGESDSTTARDALAFLHSHILPGGGVATYRPESRVDRPAESAINPDWYIAHSCVTAAAALCRIGTGPLEFLRQSQQPDGCWSDYWWKNPAYATTHGAEALAVHGTVEDTARINRAVSWAENCLSVTQPDIDPIKSPFDTSLAMRLLLLAPIPPLELISQTLQRLLSGQRADGSWTATALLSIPNSCGQKVPALDHRRVFTTATVLRMLYRLSTQFPSLTGESAAT